MPTPEEYEAAARRREIEELKRIWDEDPNNPENYVPTDEEIQQAIQDQDMEEGDYLQAPYDFNQAMQIGQYFASQGMPPEIDPKKHRQNQRQEKIRDLSERPGTSAEGEAAKRKLKRPEDIPPFLQSVEMGEIYNRDKELYGEFDRLVEEARNSSGREKKALLQRAGRVREQIESGKDPMTIGEFGYKVAYTLLPDPRNPAEMAEFTLDAYMAVQSGGVIPAAKILAKKTIGKKLIKEIFAKTIKPGGKYVDEVIQGAKERIRGVESIFEGGPGASIAGNVGTGLDKTIRELPNTLDPAGPRVLKGNRYVSSEFTTGKRVEHADEAVFTEAGWNLLDQMNEAFGGGVKINRSTSPFNIHHKGVVRQIAESLNGLTAEAAKAGGDYMSKRLGYILGYSAENASIVPTKFHHRIHDIINNRIAGNFQTNIKGLETKLGLPSDWQRTMGLQERIDARIFDEITDAIGESTKALDTFWQGLTTRTNLGNLSADDFMDSVLEVLELDKKLDITPRTTGLSSGGNATEAINELLQRAGRIDLSLPVFKELTPEMSKELVKFTLQENGWKALQEVITTGQDSTTIFKTYGIKTKGFEEVLQQLGIPGIGKTKELGTGKFLGRPKGRKTDPKKLQKQRKKKYDEDPDLNQGNTGRDETKPMDPPPDD